MRCLESAEQSTGDDQYDTIAELLSRRMVIYTDETGWKSRLQIALLHLGIFDGNACVLFRCGVGQRQSRSSETILGKSFEGIGVTRYDYGAYQSVIS